MKKLIVTTIIGLFLGVAIAPSINADIEVENYPIDIQLSETEISDINQIMDDLRKDVEAVDPDEVIDLYLDAIDELYEYGILGPIPKQFLILLMNFLNVIYSKLNDYSLSEIDLDRIIGRIDNSNCRVVAKATIYPWKRRLIVYIPKFVNPVKLNMFIDIGDYYEEIGDWSYNPAHGWISTNGASGNVSWNSTELYGQLYFFITGLGFGTPPAPWYFMRKHYVGISHYSGLYFPIPDLVNVEFTYYYMGWALLVGIDETPP